MSLITDFLAMFGAHQTIKSAHKDETDIQQPYSNHFYNADVHCNLNIDDICDEELEEVIDEEWD